MTSAPPCRLHRHRFALISLLTAAAVMAGFAVATPAVADIRTVTIKADLDQQLTRTLRARRSCWEQHCRPSTPHTTSSPRPPAGRSPST